MTDSSIWRKVTAVTTSDEELDLMLTVAGRCYATTPFLSVIYKESDKIALLRFLVSEGMTGLTLLGWAAEKCGGDPKRFLAEVRERYDQGVGEVLRKR